MGCGAFWLCCSIALAKISTLEVSVGGSSEGACGIWVRLEFCIAASSRRKMPSRTRAEITNMINTKIRGTPLWLTHSGLSVTSNQSLNYLTTVVLSY